jgi:hypothetical protein
LQTKRDYPGDGKTYPFTWEPCWIKDNDKRVTCQRVTSFNMSDPAWTLTFNYFKHMTDCRDMTDQRPYSRPLGQMCATHQPVKDCRNSNYCQSWDKWGQGKPAPPFYSASVNSKRFFVGC